MRARTLAWADRRDAALALNTPCTKPRRDSYDLAWTQALALRQGEWPQRALPALAIVQAAKPDASDTRSLVDAVEVAVSAVSAPLVGHSDSDAHRLAVPGSAPACGWAIAGACWPTPPRARALITADGPFAPSGGGDLFDQTRAVGLRYAPSPDIALEGWIGRSHLDDDTPVTDDATIGRLALSHRASDAVSYVTADRDRESASPRALAVLRNGLAADMRWTPSLRDTLAGRVALHDFDDDNRRQSFLADYRHATWRGDHVMLDLGGQAEWQHNDPQYRQRLLQPRPLRPARPAGVGVLQPRAGAGLYLSAALGVQRDETFDNWKRAGDFNAELTLGIYSPWQLVAGLGYSQRLNQFGRYEGTNAGMRVAFRFCASRPGRCP